MPGECSMKRQDFEFNKKNPPPLKKYQTDKLKYMKLL